MPSKNFFRLALFASALTLAVVILGAYVRLSHAGLGCPDWPVCYGQISWPTHAEEVSTANLAFPTTPVSTEKAWKEQIHRHFAAILGVLVLSLALLANWKNRKRLAAVIVTASAAAAGTVLYILGQPQIASAFSIVALAVPAFAAFAWSRSHAPHLYSRFCIVLLGVIIFQAMLGMWTVTWQLKPIVVMAHLLGGLTTLSLLAWLVFRQTASACDLSSHRLRAMVIVGLVLLSIQIALGGWTSANYAALACGVDYPKCIGEWLPITNFSEGFVLWRGIGVNYEGGVLDGAARAAIHLSHRWFAVLLLGHLLAVAWRCWKIPRAQQTGLLLTSLVTMQFALGISNVIFALPLWVASLHNAGAAMLLLVLVWLLARSTPATVHSR